VSRIQNFPAGTDHDHRTTVTAAIRPGDLAFVADAGPQLVTLGCNDLLLFGSPTSIESLIAGWSELLSELREHPERGELLLPALKRRDPEARRGPIHPFLWRID
jgi:hypothetical protein